MGLLRSAFYARERLDLTREEQLAAFFEDEEKRRLGWGIYVRIST